MYCLWNHVHPDTFRLPWYTNPLQYWAERPATFHYPLAHRQPSTRHRLALRLPLHISPSDRGACHRTRTIQPWTKAVRQARRPDSVPPPAAPGPPSAAARYSTLSDASAKPSLTTTFYSFRIALWNDTVLTSLAKLDRMSARWPRCRSALTRRI